MRMKIPTLFTLNMNMDEKIRQALKEMDEQNIKKEKDIKHPEEEKGLKIIVYSNDPIEFNIKNILVCVSYSRKKEGFFLDASSGDDFYLPVSDNLIDWSSRNIKKKGMAFLKNKKNLMDYFETLKKENEGFFAWQDNDFVSRLKEEFEWYQSNKN